MLVENGSQCQEKVTLYGLPVVLAILGVAVAPLSALPAPVQVQVSDHPGATVERETVLMGTRLRARVTAPDRAGAIEQIGRVFRSVEHTESLLSTWREDSELARVNAAPVDRPVRVTGELFELLVEVGEWSRRTDGAVEPAVGSLVDAWDLRGEGRRPSPAERKRARAAAAPDCFAYDHRARTVERRCADGWIDAGAFGKGEALSRARGVLEEGPATAALLDFGGQILAVGSPPDAGTWRVGVAHPDRRDRAAAVLHLRDASAATTSPSERFVEVEGERIGHVLDPRSGAPVPDRGSVTVVAGDPLAADLLSTALYVMGRHRGADWAEDRGIAALFLGSSPCFTPAMRSHLESKKESNGSMEMKPCT